MALKGKYIFVAIGTVTILLVSFFISVFPSPPQIDIDDGIIIDDTSIDQESIESTGGDGHVEATRRPRPYNREAAFGYAKRWWDGANTPEYNDYSGSGGDCANFVSQCLIAGGISFHEGMFSTSKTMP